jgi:hypothetical protein
MSMQSEKKKRRRRVFFHTAGLGVVAVWLILMGLLVKKVHFSGAPASMGTVSGEVSLEGDEREWKEIFLKGRKVGYAVSMLGARDQEYLVQEELFLKLDLMDLGQSLYAATWVQLDRSLRLTRFKLMMTSGVVRFEISGRVEDRMLVVTDERHGAQRIQRIPLHEVPMVSASLPLFFKTRSLTPGESFFFPLFDPATLSQKNLSITVTGKERLTVNRIPYEALRLEGELWGKPVIFWIDGEGRTLKEEGFMGLTIVRSSASRAPRGLEGEGADDFYELFAVPTNRMIPDPERLGYLKVRLEGVELLNPLLNQVRQRMSGGFLEITKERLPSEDLGLLPFQDIAEEVVPFLSPELHLESDDPRVMDAAYDISGDAKDPLSVAGKLLHWVYRNIEKKPVLSVPSALEVLKTRVGDCNEHAALLTALLRASGIPARLSVGLVYSRDKFYYHAWTEAWLGEWISMDPTLNQMPADASHIKWAEGGLDRQVEIVRLMDSLKIEVIDFRHD